MEERCRAIGVLYHTSRSAEAAKLMAKRSKVAATLSKILEREGGYSAVSEEHNALMAMAAVALVNMGGDAGGGLTPHTLLLLLDCAMRGRPYGDIRWRVYDLLYPVEMLTRDRAAHPAFLREGTPERVLAIIEDWFPGMYMSEFPAGASLRVHFISRARRVCICPSSSLVARALAAVPPCGRRALASCARPSLRLPRPSLAFLACHAATSLIASCQNSSPWAAATDAAKDRAAPCRADTSLAAPIRPLPRRDTRPVSSRAAWARAGQTR
jgi:hypothetical protein